MANNIFLIKKFLQGNQYEFVASYEQKGKFLSICIHVVNDMINKFRKEQNNSTELKAIADFVAFSLNESFRFRLNPYDSGTEWQGYYQHTRQTFN